MSPPHTLFEWLALLETRHPKAIDLGLDRVRAVKDRLGLQPACSVITVAGTNGKGSVCAYLEAMLSAAGYQVGCYTSPHLLRYNERVRIGRREASDADLVAAFDAVEQARGGTSLTYFEQGTLAAVWLFQRQDVDVMVLEVGLGGRLDAVNLWDADCAVVTAIDLDHQDYLGPDRESIGFEKAGIFRPGRPAVCGDPNPPRSLLDHAARLGTPLLRLGREIRHEQGGAHWRCQVGETAYAELPRPAMAGRHQFDNAAAAVAALDCLRARLPVGSAAMRQGLAEARQPGRFQQIGERPRRILDVAHNRQSARSLAENLRHLPDVGTVHAVFAMLGDKDIAAVVAELRDVIGHWHIAGLAVPRGADAETLGRVLQAAGLAYTQHADLAAAWRAACEAAGPADTIAAFGSFYTVAEIMSLPEDLR
ncbi:dihydrofolate synthase/folylpolyglutamate synthase [Sulfuritortus calidifontis]|uniref:Dihydrofolate synthase/folylpolyglutamate synthase n=1 Tax=Sulfuritortus calidifontis TaxID=1914471 RepID=A0A4R3K045_9PROT|nr:bifunctional tetrahydrofolate synthase/dihydrofolate synthase [Sulfuritortus calidifontis]TCS72936.1 dihydrofolate synthase/folylpolyglutamate synthase [Sulfuritortus calidifontis]